VTNRRRQREIGSGEHDGVGTVVVDEGVSGVIATVCAPAAGPIPTMSPMCTHPSASGTF
jgi:hypothetical protein